jgi:uncharacterized protein
LYHKGAAHHENLSTQEVELPEILRSAYDMISAMQPQLRPGTFVFVTTDDPALIALISANAISTFREEEGMSMLVCQKLADEQNLKADLPMRCITLNVYSSLEGVGLTAAVATALGANGIPCNIIAAFHHDHVFVPASMSDQALEILTSLQDRAGEH